eukprot:scaffold446131_cov35-Prasinocladus_malaysianus.AAC.1
METLLSPGRQADQTSTGTFVVYNTWRCNRRGPFCCGYRHPKAPRATTVGGRPSGRAGSLHYRTSTSTWLVALPLGRRLGCNLYS